MIIGSAIDMAGYLIGIREVMQIKKERKVGAWVTVKLLRSKLRYVRSSSDTKLLRLR